MAIASVSTITSKTLRGITGLQGIEEKARVENGKSTEFPVTMQVIFLLEEESP